MMTERLYYDDAYLTEFDARVAACRGDGWIALDRSAFYPTSGGQPFDTGTLTGEEGEFHVADVDVEKGVVWHKIGAPLPLGAQVRGVIDWDRRWDHMQQHAGDHLLAGAIWREMGGVTLGLHTGGEDSSIDVQFSSGRTRLTEEETAEIEKLVNEQVQRDEPIRCWFPDEKELASLPLRKRPTVSEHVRVVAMGDSEMVPCGGTHPASTGQIGPIKILSTAPSRGNMRLTFVSGMRAIRYFQETARCAKAVSSLLNTGIGQASQALQKERESQETARREMEKRLLEAVLFVIRQQKKGRVYAAHVPFADPNVLSRAAAELIREEGTAALLSCPGGAGRYMAFARSGDLALDMARLMRESGARGGGKPDFAQGSASDGEALLKAAGVAEEQMGR